MIYLKFWKKYDFWFNRWFLINLPRLSRLMLLIELDEEEEEEEEEDEKDEVNALSNKKC